MVHDGNLSMHEFRQRCREVAAVYRGQAEEFDSLAAAEWVMDSRQGIFEAGVIFEKTERAMQTLAAELEES